jgi:hypothetical protein
VNSSSSTGSVFASEAAVALALFAGSSDMPKPASATTPTARA